MLPNKQKCMNNFYYFYQKLKKSQILNLNLKDVYGFPRGRIKVN